VLARLKDGDGQVSDDDIAPWLLSDDAQGVLTEDYCEKAIEGLKSVGLLVPAKDGDSTRWTTPNWSSFHPTSTARVQRHRARKKVAAEAALVPASARDDETLRNVSGVTETLRNATETPETLRNATKRYGTAAAAAVGVRAGVHACAREAPTLGQSADAGLDREVGQAVEEWLQANNLLTSSPVVERHLRLSVEEHGLVATLAGIEDHVGDSLRTKRVSYVPDRAARYAEKQSESRRPDGTSWAIAPDHVPPPPWEISGGEA